MKIAVGLMLTVFGMLLVIYGTINNAAYSVYTGIKGVGMLPFGLLPPSGVIFLFGAILVVVGCTVYELGIKGK
jgi:hypothetical protein